MKAHLPTLAFAIGDPAGIGPELAARLLANEEIAEKVHFIVIGDRRVLELGTAQAGVTLDLPVTTLAELETGNTGPEIETRLIDLGNCDPRTISIGKASAESGSSALSNFRCGLALAAAGHAQALFFTPFNKSAMRLADASYVDEITFADAVLKPDRPASEYNVLDEVWNARVTSHIPIADVASQLSEERITASIQATFRTMQAAGHERPRIGVAALNPHAGDGGIFGTEDDAMVAPAVEKARLMQIPVTGPIPSDTVFVRAMRGEFDAVVTMYHDQGQIAMKLIGFDRGVTLLGGYHFPIVTPAHGTAYDIAGQGIANDGAAKKAVELAARLVSSEHAGADQARRVNEQTPQGIEEVLRAALAA